MNKFHELTKIYSEIKDEIEQKQLVFETIWELGSKEILPEVIFCLCTPQSKAENCWNAIKELSKTTLLEERNMFDISEVLGKSGVRFKKNKAKYIVEALNRFSDIDLKKFLVKNINKNGIIGTREWLADNVKGMGMKEASHFLRNIGFGNDICILDRHILRCLEEYGVISFPKTLNKKAYLEIEQEMKKFAKEISIPVFALDFVFWNLTHKGTIFK